MDAIVRIILFLHQVCIIDERNFSSSQRLFNPSLYWEILHMPVLPPLSAAAPEEYSLHKYPYPAETVFRLVHGFPVCCRGRLLIRHLHIIHSVC